MLTAVSMGFSISSSSEDNVASGILFTHSPQTTPAQASLKVTKKVLVFRKVARSCFLSKKLLKILKVAKKLPSRIGKGLILKTLTGYRRGHIATA